MIMNNKAILYLLLITGLTFFTNSADGQHVYKKATVKKITKKEYFKIISDKQKRDKQNRNRPFVYKFI